MWLLGQHQESRSYQGTQTRVQIQIHRSCLASSSLWGFLVDSKELREIVCKGKVDVQASHCIWSAIGIVYVFIPPQQSTPSQHPQHQSGTHLNPVPSDATNIDLSFCGSMIQSDIAAKLRMVILIRWQRTFSCCFGSEKSGKRCSPTFASNLKTTTNNINNNVFARQSEMKERDNLGSMESSFVAARRKRISKPRSILTTTTTTTTTTTMRTKRTSCPNSLSTARSKYFSSSTSSGTKSSTRSMLLKSLKGQNNQSNKNSKVESATQKILNRVTSATMQSDSISKRFDPISTRSSLDRFDLSSTTSSTTTSISKKDSLSRFQMKEEEEEVTSSQRDDFQMAATLMRSPDRVVQATAVNLLDDTSFDSLESPAICYSWDTTKICKEEEEEWEFKEVVCVSRWKIYVSLLVHHTQVSAMYHHHIIIIISVSYS